MQEKEPLKIIGQNPVLLETGEYFFCNDPCFHKCPSRSRLTGSKGQKKSRELEGPRLFCGPKAHNSKIHSLLAFGDPNYLTSNKDKKASKF